MSNIYMSYLGLCQAACFKASRKVTQLLKNASVITGDGYEVSRAAK